MDEDDFAEPLDSHIALWTSIAVAILMLGVSLCCVSLYLLTDF